MFFYKTLKGLLQQLLVRVIDQLQAQIHTFPNEDKRIYCTYTHICTHAHAHRRHT